MRARIALAEPDTLSPAGRRIFESILASRGNVDGPFLAWLHSAELADPAEKLGAFCRYKTRLPAIESELLILLVAAQARCVGEWQIHAPIAAKAGLDIAAIEDIRSGRRPHLPSPRLDALYDFAHALLSTHRVSEDVFNRMTGLAGCQGVVELVGILGYYSFVAMTLNAFDMTLADDAGRDLFP